MNKTDKIIISGTTGTSIMTIASYLMSLIADENFSEPDHLATMIARVVPGLSKQSKMIAGWGAHVTMGLVFATIYIELWESKSIKPTIKNGILIGALSGVVGYLIWKATFKAHPLPPFVDYNKFYFQRIPAHIIFAIGATIAYRLLQNSPENQKIL